MLLIIKINTSNLLLLTLNSTIHGPELSDVRAPVTGTLEELGVSEVVAPRLRAPHGVRVAHRDVRARGDAHTGTEDLEHLKQD